VRSPGRSRSAGVGHGEPEQGPEDTGPRRPSTSATAAVYSAGTMVAVDSKPGPRDVSGPCHAVDLHSTTAMAGGTRGGLRRLRTVHARTAGRPPAGRESDALHRDREEASSRHRHKRCSRWVPPPQVDRPSIARGCEVSAEPIGPGAEGPGSPRPPGARPSRSRPGSRLPRTASASGPSSARTSTDRRDDRVTHCLGPGVSAAHAAARAADPTLVVGFGGPLGTPWSFGVSRRGRLGRMAAPLSSAYPEHDADEKAHGHEPENDDGERCWHPVLHGQSRT
jgi:hypothetical protein